LKVSERSARRLVRNIITKDYLAELKALPKTPAKTYLLRQRDLLRKYTGIFQDLRDADAVLAWQPNGHSPSPYKPYWKIGFDGRVWYVTQEMKVIS
ncbi:MAG: hypothetical protein NTY34_08745, partial [Candidatus Omnitrophica bacterium]|nr:hypothetical protein [Candidatus Omnitrophota bacterium]